MNMINVLIPEMSCGHCEKSIRKELAKVDQAAKLVFDLTTRQLTIQSRASEAVILNAIVEAGYEYEKVAAEEVVANQVAAKEVEAPQCCGHCS